MLFDDEAKRKSQKWEDFLPDLICACAKAAKQKKYSHFGIQNFAQCWSGRNARKTYDIDGKSDKCISTVLIGDAGRGTSNTTSVNIDTEGVTQQQTTQVQQQTTQIQQQTAQILQQTTQVPSSQQTEQYQTCTGNNLVCAGKHGANYIYGLENSKFSFILLLPCIMSVQYILEGGCAVQQGMFSTPKGYHEYTGGYHECTGDIMINVGGVHWENN